jgi:hypothetical protein
MPTWVPVTAGDERGDHLLRLDGLFVTPAWVDCLDAVRPTVAGWWRPGQGGDERLHQASRRARAASASVISALMTLLTLFPVCSEIRRTC